MRNAFVRGPSLYFLEDIEPLLAAFRPRAFPAVGFDATELELILTALPRPVGETTGRDGDIFGRFVLS